MNHKSASGFTVIEILIVLLITVLISSAIISGFRNYQRYQQYQIFVTDIKNGLNEARIKTLGSVNGDTYGVYVGTTTVEFFSGVTPTVGSASNSIVSFPNGLYATSTFSNSRWYMNFNRITGIGSATGSITIIDAAQGTSVTLSVTSAGIIE